MVLFIDDMKIQHHINNIYWYWTEIYNVYIHHGTLSTHKAVRDRP